MKIKEMFVKDSQDILDMVYAPLAGHAVSRDIANALVVEMNDDDGQQRLEGVAEFLHNLADAIDDGVLVA